MYPRTGGREKGHFSSSRQVLLQDHFPFSINMQMTEMEGGCGVGYVRHIRTSCISKCGLQLLSYRGAGDGKSVGEDTYFTPFFLFPCFLLFLLLSFFCVDGFKEKATTSWVKYMSTAFYPVHTVTDGSGSRICTYSTLNPLSASVECQCGNKPGIPFTSCGSFSFITTTTKPIPAPLPFRLLAFIWKSQTLACGPSLGSDQDKTESGT